jgi:hypothetical protein
MGVHMWIMLLIVGQVLILSSATEFRHDSTIVMTCSEHARGSCQSCMHDQPMDRASGGMESKTFVVSAQELVETMASTELVGSSR